MRKKIFVTVGSAYPFDRLVRACDDAAARHPEHDWLAQIHEGTYEPTHMRFERLMDKQAFDTAMTEADLVVGHAGMGTISGALALDKPLLVLPRLRRFGESVNDHQVSCARHFRSGGHLLAADDAGDVGPLLERLPTFVPAPRRVRAAQLADDIGTFLQSC
jgi:UDP-N-acetylglucosamine transferase subunit ALG13